MTASPTNPPPRDADTEVARLRRQNAELNDQIKLLVRTEQELYRSRTALNRELERIQALGRFALASSSELDTAAAVMDHATSLLGSVFDLDHARVLQISGNHARVLNTGREVEIDPEGLEHLRRLPTVLSPYVDDAVMQWLEPVSGMLEALFPELSPDIRGASLVLIPLRPGDELFGLIGACRPRTARRSFHREAPGETHRPFLQLLESHLNSALQNTSLKKYLLEQSTRLAEANQRLTTSLEHLERTQDQLVQAQKMEAVGRLAGGVAHDFNNLLTVITGRAELLRRHTDNPEAHQDLDRIRDAGDRAARIINQLLAFSRRQRGKPEAIDVGHLASDMGDLLGRLIGAHVRLHLVLGDGSYHVWADRAQVEQILLNLVVNARDAMPHGGTVTLSLSEAKPEVLARAKSLAEHTRFVNIEVSDQGEGMDEATRAQIFEPFFTTKELGRGTGLGLSTVYGLVQLNQGDILVESAPGKGSRFSVLLPATEAAIATSTPSPPALDTAAPVSRCVLLVEDEEGIRDLAAHILEAHGYHVLVAGDGIEALEAARQSPRKIDLLLSDVVMPRLGGPALARQLVTRDPDLRVLLMTGYAPEDIDVAEDWIVLAKPFTPTDLVEAVHQSLGTGKP